MPPRHQKSVSLVRPADPMAYAQCRSMGHEWRHRGTANEHDHAPFSMFGAVGLVSQCSDCKTRRVKWVTRSGEVITRYEHPDGYSLHGDERMTTREWRSSFVTRYFEPEAKRGTA